jgi:hypothetical protein
MIGLRVVSGDLRLELAIRSDLADVATTVIT